MHPARKAEGLLEAASQGLPISQEQLANVLAEANVLALLAIADALASISDVADQLQTIATELGGIGVTLGK